MLSSGLCIPSPVGEGFLFMYDSWTFIVACVISAQMRPDRARAAELQAQFGEGFEGICKRIWPTSPAVRMFSTGAFANYAILLLACEMKGLVVFSPSHVGSEGIYGINMWLNTCKPTQTRYLSALPMFQEYLPVGTGDTTVQLEPKLPEEVYVYMYICI